MQSDYPEQYQKTSKLADGTEIFLRPIKPTDDDMMIELFNSLSRDTVFLKFFSSMKTLTKQQLEKITHIDYKKEMAIVALVRNDGVEKSIAVGRYTQVDDEPGYAEFAIVVQDSHQGHGLGTEMLWHLAHVAKLEGVEVIVGYIMSENARMFSVLKRSGLKMKKKFWDRGVTRVDIPIDENILIR
jgi:acetyltransferase